MRFKLDENFGSRCVSLFADSGHDVQTVRDESLQGVSDSRLFLVCRKEQRCLVSLDLDFCSVVRFPPADGAGIAVLRLPAGFTLGLLQHLVRQLLSEVAHTPIAGRLWVVEPGRIRVHDTDDGGAV